jgi:phospholipid N-methyltransferase
LMISSNIYEDLYTRHHDIIDNETERLTIERRINRLLHILSNSDGKEIIFMRYLNDGYLTRKLQDNCVNNLTLSEDNLSTTLSSITDFLDMLSTTYPNVKKFKLLLFTSSRLLYEQVNNETIANCKISLVPEVSIPSKTVLQNLIRDNN